MSVLIGGVTYRTVKIGRGRRLHLVRGTYTWTYCGREVTPVTRTVDHGAEDEALCDNCDAYARKGRERRTP